MFLFIKISCCDQFCACFLLSCHVITILMFVFYSQFFVIFCGINYLIKFAKFVKAIFCLCIIWFIMVFISFLFFFLFSFFLFLKLEIYIIKRIFCVNCVCVFFYIHVAFHNFCVLVFFNLPYKKIWVFHCLDCCSIALKQKIN